MPSRIRLNPNFKLMGKIKYPRPTAHRDRIADRLLSCVGLASGMENFYPVVYFVLRQGRGWRGRVRAIQECLECFGGDIIEH